MTNFIETDQSHSQCGESPMLSEALCRNDSDCQNKPYMPNANGRWTGRCIFSTDDEQKFSNRSQNERKGVCEMQGKSTRNTTRDRLE